MIQGSGASASPPGGTSASAAKAVPGMVGISSRSQSPNTPNIRALNARRRSSAR